MQTVKRPVQIWNTNFSLHLSIGPTICWQKRHKLISKTQLEHNPSVQMLSKPSRSPMYRLWPQIRTHWYRACIKNSSARKESSEKSFQVSTLTTQTPDGETLNSNVTNSRGRGNWSRISTFLQTHPHARVGESPVLPLCHSAFSLSERSWARLLVKQVRVHVTGRLTGGGKFHHLGQPQKRPNTIMTSTHFPFYWKYTHNIVRVDHTGHCFPVVCRSLLLHLHGKQIRADGEFHERHLAPPCGARLA